MIVNTKKTILVPPDGEKIELELDVSDYKFVQQITEISDEITKHANALVDAALFEKKEYLPATNVDHLRSLADQLLDATIVFIAARRTVRFEGDETVVYFDEKRLQEEKSEDTPRPKKSGDKKPAKKSKKGSAK